MAINLGHIAQSFAKAFNSHAKLSPADAAAKASTIIQELPCTSSQDGRTLMSEYMRGGSVRTEADDATHTFMSDFKSALAPEAINAFKQALSWFKGERKKDFIPFHEREKPKFPPPKEGRFEIGELC